ncbi:MAG: YeeE/YedE thiosulfate transporter family protein [Desulfovibrionales bacterium]
MRRGPLGKLLLGLATGTAFGFFLHKGRAAEHEAISNQLRLDDARVIKIMATATAVGAMGTHLLKEMEFAELKIKPLNLGGVVLGGSLFGAGMAILGYCPGTTMAAIGRGHKDAMVGALGMLGGALLFVTFFPYLQPLMEKGSLGKRTLPEMTGTSPWVWVVGTSAAAATIAELLGSD